MRKRAIITMLTTTCLLIGLAVSDVARADLGAQKNSQAPLRKRQKENSQGHGLEEGLNCLPVM